MPESRWSRLSDDDIERIDALAAAVSPTPPDVIDRLRDPLAAPDTEGNA